MQGVKNGFLRKEFFHGRTPERPRLPSVQQPVKLATERPLSACRTNNGAAFHNRSRLWRSLSANAIKRQLVSSRCSAFAARLLSHFSLDAAASTVRAKLAAGSNPVGPTFSACAHGATSIARTLAPARVLAFLGVAPRSQAMTSRDCRRRPKRGASAAPQVFSATPLDLKSAPPAVGKGLRLLLESVIRVPHGGLDVLVPCSLHGPRDRGAALGLRKIRLQRKHGATFGGASPHVSLKTRRLAMCSSEGQAPR